MSNDRFEQIEGALSALRRLIVYALFFQILVLVYLPSMKGEFLYDDMPSIPGNEDLRHPLEPWRLLRSHDTSLQFDRRPVGGLVTLANFQISGTHPLGYRIVNLFLHWLCMMVLAEFAIALARRFQFPSPRLFGLALAVLWALHPLNTMPVAYIYQRMEILMALFFLLALFALLHADRINSAKWLAIAWCAAVLSYFSKEVSVLLPFAMILCDRLCNFDSLAALARARGKFYASLFAVWIAGGIWFLSGSRVGELSVSDPLSTPFGYFKAQCREVLGYLRLAVFPDGLVFFRTPRYAGSASAWVPHLAVLIFLGAAVLMAGRSPKRRWIWLAGGVFALVLAPTPTATAWATSWQAVSSGTGSSTRR